MLERGFIRVVLTCLSLSLITSHCTSSRFTEKITHRGHLNHTDALLHPTAAPSTQDTNACTADKMRHTPFPNMDLLLSTHTHTQVMARTDRSTHTAFDSERPAVLLSGHPRERNVAEQRKNAYKGNKCRSCCGVEGRRESHWARTCQDLSITPADILAASWRLKAGGEFFTHCLPSTEQV